jgi:hypothetical protein
VVHTKSPLFHHLKERDHEKSVREHDAVLIFPDQMLYELFRAPPGLDARFRLPPRIEQPLRPADS